MNEQKKSNTILIVTIITAVLALAVATVAVIFVINKGGNKLDKHLSLGQKYLEDGDYEEAIAEFEMALEIDPMCVKAYQGITEAYIELEDYITAKELLEKALELFEDEGEKSDIKKITKLIDKVDKAANYDYSITDSAAEDTPAQEVGPAEETPVAEAPVDNRQVLEDYYDNLIIRDFPIKYDEVFTMECKYTPESVNGNQSVNVASPLDGVISHMFYDYDFDGEEELIIASYASYDEIIIKFIEVQNGTAVPSFLCEISAGLCGDAQEASINIGFCEKNNELYITVENELDYNLFADGAYIFMKIYKVTGNTTSIVFNEYLCGSDFYGIEESDEFKGFQSSLRSLGFNRTADSLSEKMQFAVDEGISPFVFGHSRHSSSYDNNFDYNAFWNNDPNPDAGEKAFIFTLNKEDGYDLMDRKYPYRWQ